MDSLCYCRCRFNIPISDEQLADIPYFRPAADSPEMQDLHERRRSLQGYLPKRRVTADEHLQIRSEEHTSELQSRGHLVSRLLLEKNKPIPPGARYSAC